MSRLINVFGEINDESYIKFARRLTRLLEESHEPIGLRLISEGGSATAALAYYDSIRRSPAPITITATGLVASAATLILAAGNYRIMTKNAWVMVHEDSCGDDIVKVSELERAAKHMRQMEDQWNALLSERTKASAKVWAELNLIDNYLSAETCLELGLIDEIV